MRSREERPGGSLPTFVSSDVATRIPAITAGHSLAPPSSTRTAIVGPCGRPTLKGDRTGLPCSAAVTTSDLGPLKLRRQRWAPMTGENGAPVPTAFRPISIVGLFILDDAWRGFACADLVTHSSPLRLMLAELHAPHGLCSGRATEGYIVRGLLDTPLPECLPRRVLLMGQQV